MYAKLSINRNLKKINVRTPMNTGKGWIKSGRRGMNACGENLIKIEMRL